MRSQGPPNVSTPRHPIRDVQGWKLRRGHRPSVSALIRHAADPFRGIHEALAGLDVDWDKLDPSALSEPLLDLARTIWTHRVQTEFRSIQVMTRFLQEVLGAGDPLEVYAGAAQAVVDEIRHTALCVGVVEALGIAPVFPEPIAEPENPRFLALPMVQRALGTAVSMLAISETLSVALLEDLQERATHPTIAAVLHATLEDEDTHGDFGWAYVRASLERCDEAGMAFAQMVAETTLEPYLVQSQHILAKLTPRQRCMDAWHEPELAALGLMSNEREALVTMAAIHSTLRPRLLELGIAPDVLRSPGPRHDRTAFHPGRQRRGIDGRGPAAGRTVGDARGRLPPTSTRA